MLLSIIVAFVIIYVPTASTQQTSITSTTTGDVVLGSDAVLTWEVKFAEGMTPFVEKIHNGTKYGPLLWNSALTVNKLPAIFGERVTVQKKNIFLTGYILELLIKNVDFNDSMKFTYSASFGKTGADFASEALNSTIQLKVSGINVTADLLPNITVEENQKTTFSVTIAGVPKPNVTWTFTGEAKTTDTQKELDAVMKQYEYTSEINSFGAADCGHTLSYKAIGHTKKNGQVTINVLFTPSQVNNVQFYHLEEECQELTWDKVEAGKCGQNVQYKIKIMNGSDVLSFTTDGEVTTFQVCNATDALNATVEAVYEGKTGKESKAALFKKEKPTTTTTTTTTKKPIVITGKTTGDTSNIGIIAGGAVGGIVVLILIIILVVCVLKKKKNEGVNDSGEEIHLHQWQQNHTKENHYSTAAEIRPQPKEDPNQAIYSELGPGGRAGPKPAPAASNYAEVKVDNDGYPIVGEPIEPVDRTPYDQIRKNSDDDFDTGIIV